MNRKITTTLFVLVSLIVLNVTINADMIRTTIYTNGDALEKQNTHLQLVKEVTTITIPPVDIEALIAEDNQLDEMGIGRPYRFGAKIHTTIRISDGQWFSPTESHNVWAVGDAETSSA